MPNLRSIVEGFARGLKVADAQYPRFRKYSPGIGPHPEPLVVRMVADFMATETAFVDAQVRVEEPYPESGDRCDFAVLVDGTIEWGFEVKAIRGLHNNGKPAPEVVKQILSPYPDDRSALTDSAKVLEFPAQARGLLLYCYDYPERPFFPLLRAFESLLTQTINIVERCESAFDGLVHPYHQRGAVIGYRLED